MLFYNLIICHVLKMDNLKYLYEGRISEDQAYDIFDREVDAFHAGEFETSDDGTLLGSPFESLFGMDNFEFTAKCHGVPLSIVAQWRYQGWPDKCCVTNQRIDYRNDHWLAKEIANGEYGLMKL